MNTPHQHGTTTSPAPLAISAFLLAVLLPASAQAAALTWDGGGSDDNWSTSVNWNPDTALGTTDTITFGDTDKTTESVANNIVSASQTITSLTYNNTGTTASDWQVTEIASGQTLSIGTNSATGTMVIGSGTSASTNAKITGAGSLELGTATRLGTFAFSATNYFRPTLDMSGLSSFTAYTSTFNVGGSSSLATLTLAQSNTITTTTLSVGTSSKNTSTGAGQSSVLNLGASNTINADTINVGGVTSRTGGTLKFASTGGSVTIRGSTGGTSRANLTLGQSGDGSQSTTNTVDFTNNTVDALFGTLTVGGNSTGNGPITGNFSMSAGTVDATSVVVGKRTSTGSGAAIGVVNVSGGSFSAGSIQMGSTASTNAANATLNITGGTVTLGGDIAEGSGGGTGTVTSTLTLNGGTLDMGGHSVTVDTFNVQSGTLKNLGQFNSGAALSKTTAGALVLDGANAYSGNTSVSAGSVTLASTGSLTFFIGANGVSNKVTGAGAATFDGTFVFDLSGATLADGNTWTIADVATQSFSATFSVSGFTQSNDVWTNGAGLTFTEATGILSYSAIPEPSAFAFLGGLASLAVVGLLRRRSANACP